MSGSHNPLEAHPSPTQAHAFSPIPANTSVTNGSTSQVPNLAASQGAVDFAFVQRQGDAYYPNNTGFFVGGDIYTPLVNDVSTGGALGFLDFYVLPRDAVPQHTHAHEAEAKYVLEGEVNFDLGPAQIRVPTGSFIYYPIGRQMGFTATDQSARISVITTPGAPYYEFAGVAVVDEQGNNTPPPQADIGAIAAQLDFGVVGQIIDTYGGGAFIPGVDSAFQAGLQSPLLVVPDLDLIDPAQLEAVRNVPGLNLQIFEISDRRKFDGLFGTQNTSLIDFEESDGNFAYSQFNLARDDRHSSNFLQAVINSDQIVTTDGVGVDSGAFAYARLHAEPNGTITYEITINGLDAGAYLGDGTPFTPDPGDDLTAIHLHTAFRGENGTHAFNILGPGDDADLTVHGNADGSVTFSGVWDDSDTTTDTLPPPMSTKPVSNFLPTLSNAAVGEDVGLYVNIHSNRNSSGEIRGQVVGTTDAFPASQVADNHLTFLVQEGEVAFQVNGNPFVAGVDDAVYIAAGQNYSIANLGNQNAVGLAAAVVDSYVPKIGEYYDGNIDFTASIRTGDEFIQGNVVTTVPQAIGNGWIYTWGAFGTDDFGNEVPTSIGVTFTEEALQDAFVVDDPNNEFPSSVPHLAFPEIFEAARVYNILFPEKVQQSTPFNHMGFYANSEGHAPLDIYDLPHFDVHFFLDTIEERDLITGLPEDNANLFNLPEPGFLPANYIAPTIPGTDIPATGDALQGIHWVAGETPEFNGEVFDQTFIFGSYAGDVNFWEPMITRDFLESLSSARQVITETTYNIDQPTRFKEAGFYPLEYGISYNANHGEYTVTLDNFVIRSADGDLSGFPGFDGPPPF
ncbi:CHRD domain containing protein [Thalassoporum mexicanum PCC 7367]|uniref:cupin domain-containing protein n=1 Tax=Thalassoporum mexicanum TaxID=3457544 RepID=UPI00029FF517|nr:cupin domain-containing protein [Pseudanabaena sp. PCC 7367]AFY70362.1 CHRD domain containing protein [Pseudanabaena sp. PCC 7367]